MQEEIEELEVTVAILADKISQGGSILDSTGAALKEQYEQKKEEWSLEITSLNDEADQELMSLEKRWKPVILEAEKSLEEKLKRLEKQKQDDVAELKGRYQSNQLSQLESKRAALKKRLSKRK